jgi:hypothetical protein
VPQTVTCRVASTRTSSTIRCARVSARRTWRIPRATSRRPSSTEVDNAPVRGLYRAMGAGEDDEHAAVGLFAIERRCHRARTTDRSSTSPRRRSATDAVRVEHGVGVRPKRLEAACGHPSEGRLRRGHDGERAPFDRAQAPVGRGLERALRGVAYRGRPSDPTLGISPRCLTANRSRRASLWQPPEPVRRGSRCPMQPSPLRV